MANVTVDADWNTYDLAIAQNFHQELQIKRHADEEPADPANPFITASGPYGSVVKLLVDLFGKDGDMPLYSLITSIQLEDENL